MNRTILNLLVLMACCSFSRDALGAEVTRISRKKIVSEKRDILIRDSSNYASALEKSDVLFSLGLSTIADEELLKYSPKGRDELLKQGQLSVVLGRADKTRTDWALGAGMRCEPGAHPNDIKLWVDVLNTNVTRVNLSFILKGKEDLNQEMLQKVVLNKPCLILSINPALLIEKAMVFGGKGSEFSANPVVLASLFYIARSVSPDLACVVCFDELLEVQQVGVNYLLPHSGRMVLESASPAIVASLPDRFIRANSLKAVIKPRDPLLARDEISLTLLLEYTRLSSQNANQ